MTMIRILIGLASLAVSHGAEVEIELPPEDTMGRRGLAEFDEVVWKADSPWFGKKAPLCKVVDRPMDLSKVHRFAEEQGLERVWIGNSETMAGAKEEGAFHYLGQRPDPRAAMGNPTRRLFRVQMAKFREFERDENQMAVVGPIPTKEEVVSIAREWMEKLGIDEAQLQRGGTWPEGFDVIARIHREIGMDRETKERVVAEFGVKAFFKQQICGITVRGQGESGSVSVEIGDGKEFCGMDGCLRAWEKIGDYEILDRAEITEALGQGYCWAFVPFQCDTIEITKVELLVHHGHWHTPQRHFPLMWKLDLVMKGGLSDGLEESLIMPALKQHRDRFRLDGER